MLWMRKTGTLTTPCVSALPSGAAGDGASSNADLLFPPRLQILNGAASAEVLVGEASNLALGV